MVGKEKEDPDDPGANSSDNGHHHGNGGATHCPHGAGEEVHQAAQKIGDAGIGQYFDAITDNL